MHQRFPITHRKAQAMRLRSVEINGFKSFSSKVTLQFPTGITAIVGPNGCGKTNVIESIRWVLGEQNARALRGERMEEVIFNGTAQKKPLGMAEVRLNFDDPERTMGLEGEEFTIGRQIFRSGESNYMINRNPCLLKDVQDLFMDTGMGSNAYSMIEQKMVEAILSERAEERRFLFEEAAGIQKYKQRRRFAMRKLEATEGDLQRIEDIVGEVQRSVNSLGRQVSKARRYKKLSGKLRRVAVTLACDELARLGKEEEPLSARLEELRDRIAGLSAREATLAARSEELHANINHRRNEAEQVFSALGELNRKIREAEDEQTVIGEKKIAGRQWIEESGGRLESLRENIDKRTQELEEHSARLEALRREVAVCEEEHAVARRRAVEKREQTEAARSRLAAIQAERESLMQRVAASGSKAEALADAAAYEQNRAASAKERAAELETQLAEAVKKLEDARKLEQGTVENLKAGRAAIDEKAGELDRLRGEIDSLKEKLSAAGVRRDRLSAESELLERLQREMEGFGEGVRELLSGNSSPEGLETVAAEVFTTDSRYECAVEAALGMRLQSIITRDTDAMLQAIGKLRDSGGGVATFISRDLVNGYRGNGLRPAGEVVAFCEEVVSCDPAYEFLRKLLFGGVAIVENLEAAIALQKQNDKPLHLVTLNGETIQDYAVSGGDVSGKQAGTALLTRKRRIEEIEAELATALAEVEQLQSDLDAGQDTCRQAVEERDRLGQQRAELEEELGRLRSESTRLELDAGAVRTEGDSAAGQATQALEKSSQLAAERSDLLEKGKAAQTELASYEQKIEDSRSSVESAEQVRQEDGENLQEVGMRLTERRTRLGELENSYSLLEREHRTASGESERLEQELAGRHELLAQLDAREEELKAQLDESFGRRQGLLKERDAHEQGLSGLQAEIGEIDGTLNSIRREREQANEDRHQRELELERINSRRSSITERVHDNFGLAMDNLPVDFEYFPNEEEAAGQETADAGLVEELQEKVRKLGPVNVLAIEEYDQEKERLDFLTRQRDDLVSARSSLLKLIEEINRTARERFLDTFAKVQNNFQDIFTSLFEGGQAHISLADEDDPLESPIEVIARPRGKKMLGLNLLSGGEKALTALALLFAIYTVKPSPFCILDEADAPLDDANIDRFLTIIRRYARNTQFIIVTHNKRTMEFADCLYGVTMQDAGVSKVVSVSLSQVGEGGRIEQPEHQPVG
ncbi:MAG: chromosome segregation protein SMC [Candidatus Glassbacteria bacterium]|nr:chromosome segregation protein SMC [Candidatus Glassbacteria bacterium]